MRMIDSKIKTLKELIPIINSLRAKNKKIVTTNGVFDILHPGHIKYLEKSKQLGDLLVVGVNSDSSVKENKGDLRPINDEKSRAKVLAALESVDFVFVFGEKDPRTWLEIIKPHIHVKAGDYARSQIIESGTVEKNGGKIKILAFESGYSTTGIIERILQRYKS